MLEGLICQKKYTIDLFCQFLQKFTTESSKIIFLATYRNLPYFLAEVEFVSVEKMTTRCLKAKFLEKINQKVSVDVCAVLLQSERSCFVFATYTSLLFWHKLNVFQQKWMQLDACRLNLPKTFSLTVLGWCLQFFTAKSPKLSSFRTYKNFQIF